MVVGNATDSGHLPLSEKSVCHPSAGVLPARGSNVLMCSHRKLAKLSLSPCVAEPPAPHGRPVNRTCDPPLAHKPSTDVHNVKLRVVLSPLGRHVTAGTHGFGCGGTGGGSGGNILAAQLSVVPPAKDLDWPTSHSNIQRRNQGDCQPALTPTGPTTSAPYNAKKHQRQWRRSL